LGKWQFMGTLTHLAWCLTTYKSPCKQLIKRGKAVAGGKAVANVLK